MPGTIAVGMCFIPSSPCSGPSGCMLMHWMFASYSFSRRVVPMNVPVVPSPATKCVTRPWVCSQISRPVPS